MRGKAILPLLWLASCGITPAYAGKRMPSVLSDFKHRDHPRLCGEKHGRRFHAIIATGITPAYAGKSRSDRKTHSTTWDHPRLCGEKWEMLGLSNRYRGSPPPMRGKGVIVQNCCISSRITPAYAGKRWFRFRSGF